MKNYMKLASGYQIPIEDGASLGAICTIAETEAAAVEVCEAITPQALMRVEFYEEETKEAYGIYENLIKTTEPIRQTNDDGTVTVTISLREKTDLEKRVDALEEGQAVQDGAISDLGTAVSEMAEGV